MSQLEMKGRHQSKVPPALCSPGHVPSTGCCWAQHSPKQIDALKSWWHLTSRGLRRIQVHLSVTLICPAFQVSLPTITQVNTWEHPNPQAHDPQVPMPHSHMAVTPITALASLPAIFSNSVQQRPCPRALDRQVKKWESSTRKGMFSEFLIST